MSFHNPWRSPIEAVMAGDNYLSAGEYESILSDLDELYKLRCGEHESLNDAYANGREDQEEQCRAEIDRLRAALQAIADNERRAGCGSSFAGSTASDALLPNTNSGTPPVA